MGRTSVRAEGARAALELLARDLTDDLERGVDARAPRQTARDPQEVPEPAARREDRTGRDRDPALERGLLQLQRVDAARHLDPQDEAAARRGHPRAVGEARGDRVAIALDLSGEEAAETAQVTIVAARGEELGDRHLGQRR